jgi:hypothetical protein
MRRVLAAAMVMLFLLTLSVPAEAATRRICTRSATVYDTPRGFAIARLYRRERVNVVGRSATRGWTRIETRGGLPGWILSRSLCRRG